VILVGEKYFYDLSAGKLVLHNLPLSVGDAVCKVAVNSRGKVFLLAMIGGCLRVYYVDKDST